VVPVLRDADRCRSQKIEKAIKAYAKQAQDGTLSLERAARRQLPDRTAAFSAR